MGLVILLVVLAIGAVGYFAIRYIGSAVTNPVRNDYVNNPGQGPITTTPINATVNYASVNITILNAQQATSFADDTSTSAPGALRLNLHAAQSDVDDTGQGSNFDPYYDYPSSFAMILPGGNKVAPVGFKDVNGPTHKGVQTTWVDFPVSTTMKVNQLVLRIGKDTQVQLDIPLTGHADLSQYQPKQSSPNTRVQFGGMFWTLTTTTVKLSDSGTQADKGMRFIVLSLSIDNPTSEDLNAYPPDYMRLQYDGTTISPTGSAIGNAAAGTTNIKGLVSFLVPQGTTTGTLILLPGHTPGATSQAEIPFQVP